MMLDRFQKEYLAYEMPEDAIFNHNVWQFDPVAAVKAWRQQANRLTLTLATESGQEAFCELTFFQKDVFRFRLYRESFAPNESGIIVEQPAAEDNVRIADEDNMLHIRAGQLSISIGQDFSFEVRNSHGRLLQRFYVSGRLHDFIPSYPLGWQQDGKGRKRTFVNFELQADEALYGFGEKFSPINKRGYRINSWQSDTTGCCWDRSYKNIPFYLSSRGYGLFVHESSRIVYEAGSFNFNALTMAAENTQLEFYFFYGPSFKEILARYTAMTGRAPLLPQWSFGLWMSRFGYKNWDEVEQVVAKMRKRGIPLDVVHIDPFWMREKNYCDFVWDEKTFPDPEKHLERLRQKGVRVCLWEQPFIPVNTKRFSEAEENGYLVKNRLGRTYVMTDFENKPVGIVDFTNPAAVRWYKNIHKALLRQGVAAFKPDMGEALPEDAVLYNGKTGKEMHNLYPLLYNKTVFEACREFDAGNAVVWGRSGYAGSQRYPLNWSGDPHSTPQDMACVLHGGLSYGLSGVPFWSHDIGGFHGPLPSPWLYVRWAQFGLLSSHARAHGCQPREPWEFGPEAERIFRQFALLRYRLMPYLWTCAQVAHNTGLPVLRAMVLEFQDDPNVRELDLQYMLGPSLLVAPVFDENDEVRVYLPDGRWTDFWTDELIAGPTWIERHVPLEQVPIYIRENSVIPFGPERQYVDEPHKEFLLLDFFQLLEVQTTVVADRAIDIAAQRTDRHIRCTVDRARGDLSLRFHHVPPITQLSLTEGDDIDLEWEYIQPRRLLLVKLHRVKGHVSLSVNF